MPGDDLLSQLVRLMEQCQADTARLLPTAAPRLANWQKHQHDLKKLVAFVSRCLWVRRENPYKLYKAGGLSLEEIVAMRLPEPFGEDARAIAQATLDGRNV